MKKRVKVATLGTGLILFLISGVAVNAAWTPGMTGPGDSEVNLNGTHDFNGEQVDNWFDATDGEGKANSLGQFKIETEDPQKPHEKDGKLTLDKVPNMNFGATSVKRVSDEGAELPFVIGGVGTGLDAFDGNDNGKIQISDYRGMGTGWRLNVSIEDFKSMESGNSVVNASLILLPKIDGENTNADTPEVVSPIIIGMGQDNMVIQTNEQTRGQGKNMYMLDEETKLLLDRQNLQVGAYLSNIKWTLVNAPS